jgi:hypothetical protein
MSPALRIVIVCVDNGKGLSRDRQILSGELRRLGHTVSLIEPMYSGSHPSGDALWTVPERSPVGTFDPCLTLEMVVANDWQLAPVVGFIPNPDCLRPERVAELERYDAILVKTREAESFFKKHHRTVYYVGFASLDLSSRVDMRRAYVHCAGASWTKGTDALVAEWSAHPDWPELTVLASKDVLAGAPAGSTNIVVVQHGLQPAEFSNLMSRSMFHLCTSCAEGWGHYMVAVYRRAAHER